MSKRFILVILALGLVGFCGWAIAQQPQPKQAEPSRYGIVAVGSLAVMVDTTTGKSWHLYSSLNEDKWLPIERIEDSDQAKKWRAEQRATFDERFRRAQESKK